MMGCHGLWTACLIVCSINIMEILTGTASPLHLLFRRGRLVVSAPWRRQKIVFYQLCSSWREKIWFFVPAEYHEAVAKVFIEDYKECSHHLRHKSVFIEPSLLRERKIPVFEADQAPGEFIITFLDAVHFGSNAERNQAEAVNFATTGWILIGLTCPDSKCTTRNRCRT